MDAPTNDSTLPALRREKVATRMGIEMIFKRYLLWTIEKLTQPMIDASLDTRDSFVADHYMAPSILKVENAGDVSDDSLRE